MRPAARSERRSCARLRGTAALACAKRLERGVGCLVSAPHQLRPAAAVEEQVVEVEAGDLVELYGLDQRQAVAQAALGAPRELDVRRAAQLAAGLDPAAHATALPARDVLALEAGRQEDVEAEDVVELRLLVQQRLGREGVDDAAVDVEVALHAYGFDKQWQGHRDAHQLPEHQFWRIGRTEVFNAPAVEVVDDCMEGDVRLL